MIIRLKCIVHLFASLVLMDVRVSIEFCRYGDVVCYHNARFHFTRLWKCLGFFKNYTVLQSVIINFFSFEFRWFARSDSDIWLTDEAVGPMRFRVLISMKSVVE